MAQHVNVIMNKLAEFISKQLTTISQRNPLIALFTGIGKLFKKPLKSLYLFVILTVINFILSFIIHKMLCLCHLQMRFSKTSAIHLHCRQDKEAT